MSHNATETLAPPANLSGSHSNSSCAVEDGFLTRVLPACYSVIFVLGLLGNAVATAVFFLRSRSRSSISVYMRHMAAADLLLVLCLPLRIYYHHRRGPFLVCRLVGTFFYVNMYASILFLSLISLDRYLKIMKPVWVFRVQKVEWSRKVSYAVWALLVCGTLPFLLGGRPEGPCEEICFHFHRKSTSGAVINLVTVALFYVLALGFLGSYGQISVKLWSISLGNDEQARRKKRRVIVKTFVVPVIFTVCFMPYHAIRVPYVLAQLGVRSQEDMLSQVDAKQTLHLLNELALCLSALNSCLDPLIYFFLSSTFRKTIICVVQGKFKKMYAMNRRRSSVVKSVTEM
ncbi:G protein-coupled receptor 34 like [Conger conger]|uniref:G protein-coupled receptor 34 like n=1 Tax=Conger conger TaxID=82655 RepID=UPI002A5AB59B|nr:G protein-coupled receptor 34 like [Conger conger]XP_061106028.1 G protein-coupled receptor 34 like [Conger conger]